MKTILLIVIIWMYMLEIHAQSSSEAFQELMDDLFLFQNEGDNREIMYESLYQLYQNPIDLNQANRTELQSLNILSDNKISAIINHIKNEGKLLSIYELQAIPAITLNDINQIQSFITVKESSLQQDNMPVFKRILNERNHIFISRIARTLQVREGYKGPNKSYLGSPNQLYLRYRLSHTKDFSMGFTMEKDAGEAINWNPTKQYGPDFLSYHFQLYNIGPIKNMIIGDYKIQYGQSIIYGAGFNIGKGSNPIAIARKSNLGSIPYTSAVENNFFRGVSFDYDIGKRISFTNHFSYKKISVSKRFSADSSKVVSSTVQRSGLHRTSSALINKNNESRLDAGSILNYSSNDKHFNFGASVLYTHFSTRINKRPTQYNQFDFVGDKNLLYGIYSNIYLRNLHLFGEMAKNYKQGMGLIIGGIISLQSKLHLSILYRNYERSFNSFYSTAFSENTDPRNEKGGYVGLTYQLRKTNFNVYIDRFKFPWLKFRVNYPSVGYEYFVRIDHSLNKNIKLFIAAKVESKSRNVNQENNLRSHVIKPYLKRNYIISLKNQYSDNLRLTTRMQANTFQFNGINSLGFALIQDVKYQFRNSTISGRFALFDTQDFENRIYTYEQDVLYSFSVPAYQGTGSRSYLMLKHKLSKKIHCWIRWSRTFLPFSYVIGSGNEQIESNQRSDVKLQLLLKL